MHFLSLLEAVFPLELLLDVYFLAAHEQVSYVVGLGFALGADILASPSVDVWIFLVSQVERTLEVSVRRHLQVCIAHRAVGVKLYVCNSA